MIHTFSVTIETFEGSPFTSEQHEQLLQSEVLSSLSYESGPLGIQSVKVTPITGIQRQHLIGENDDV